MAFVIDESWLPATLTVPPMTDEAFAAFCSEHPDLFFEMTAEGELIVMPPTYSTTGARNSDVGRQLGNWAIEDGHGAATDSSTGFVLPNGARRSPDAAWTRKSRIQKLDPQQREGFWHLCPDFVVELRSHSDRLRVIRDKMREYIENGAQLGWLIDPERRSVEVYRPEQEPETLLQATSVSGEGPVAGFELDLTRVWDPLA